jgi:hypothetical protein
LPHKTRAWLVLSQKSSYRPHTIGHFSSKKKKENLLQHPAAEEETKPWQLLKIKTLLQ